MPDPVTMMGQAIAAGERGLPVSPDVAAWQAAYWRVYIAQAEAGRPISLEAAMGLGAPKRPNWVKRQARDERDATLRELHRTRFPGLAPRAAARAILAMNPCPCPMLGERQLSEIIRK